MIDIINAKKEFKNYVSSYNPEHKRVALKISHIGRVTENCKLIAESLGLTDEEVKLAQLIGLFHDLGRFEQVRIADTFSDKDSGINHGELSIKVLFEDGLIRKFIKEDTYDEIIKKAVYNHNKKQIEKNLTEKEELFCKIIRDADKLDIFYITTFEEFAPLFWYKDFDQTEICEEVVDDIKNRRLVNYENIKNNADLIGMFFAYVFDLNFQITLEKVAINKYLDKYAEKVKENFKSPYIHKQTDQLLKICNEFIEENKGNN